MMTLNEMLIRQNFITKILLKDGENELSKALKVKVMNMRITLNKVRTQFDADVQEAIKGLKPEGFDELSQKQDRSEEEEKILKEQTDKINDEYNAFIVEKGQEESTFGKSFTEEEYEQIVEVNAGNDVDINGNKLQAADFLEVIYSLFVE